MVSRDLVPMRERIAGPRGTGKPLQLAVDSVPGTTEATLHTDLRLQRKFEAIKTANNVGNEFISENNVLLYAPVVAERTNTHQPQEQVSAKPETLHGLSADTRPEPEAAFHRPRLFARQAGVLVAAKVAGIMTVVNAVSGSPVISYAQRSSMWARHSAIRPRLNSVAMSRASLAPSGVLMLCDGISDLHEDVNPPRAGCDGKVSADLALEVRSASSCSST